MSDPTDGRPRPVPRPRPGTARPSPKARVAGARRDREQPAETPAATGATMTEVAEKPAVATARPRAERAARVTGKTKPRASAVAETTPRRPRRRLAALLVVLCLAAAAAGGVLLWQRLHPRYVDPSVFTAARSGVEALYAYDYKDSDGSVARKLAVLTGPLRDQYKKDLSQGGIIDTYKQVSATTSYDVVDVGLQQINDAQDTATLVVFGQYVVKSVNSGQSDAPQGSECQVLSSGAQSCTQTVQVGVTKVDGGWKIDELTLLTTS